MQAPDYAVALDDSRTLVSAFCGMQKPILQWLVLTLLLLALLSVLPPAWVFTLFLVALIMQVQLSSAHLQGTHRDAVETSDCQKDSDSMQIFAILPSGEMISLEVMKQTTVGEVAIMIHEKTGFLIEDIVVQCGIRIAMVHDRTLASYGIKNGHKLEVELEKSIKVGDLLISTKEGGVYIDIENFFDGSVILIVDVCGVDPEAVMGIAVNKLDGGVRLGGPDPRRVSRLSMSMHVQLAEDTPHARDSTEEAHELEVGRVGWIDDQGQSNQIRWLLWGDHPRWPESQAFPNFPEGKPEEKQPLRFFQIARWSAKQLNDEVNRKDKWRLFRNDGASLIKILEEFNLDGNVEE